MAVSASVACGHTICYRTHPQTATKCICLPTSLLILGLVCNHLRRMTRAVAGLMHFRETPAYHTHPFLLAFTPRAGMWTPRRVSGMWGCACSGWVYR